MKIKLNGTEYNVGVASVSRSIRKEEKYRVTTEDGNTHREVRGTYMDFSLSIGNFGAAEYDRLMEFLRSADGNITLELPRDATTTEIYIGIFGALTDEVIGESDNEVMWDNLTLSFISTVPLEADQ